MKRVRVTPEVAVDWTKCFSYERLISEEIEHYSAIEVTQDLKEGGLAANPAWERWYRFLAASWQTDLVAEIVATARRFAAPRLLSLGCGYGGMEIACARQLRGPYEIVAVDVNEALFRRGREEVAAAGLHVAFEALDLNFVDLEPSSFDVVFAHASLHHLLNFEHLFAQVHRALQDDGRLIVLDIIGKTQILFWPENVRFATDLVARMPERFRQGLQIDPRALFTSYFDGAEQQGMEGIRQEELEEQIGRFFRPLKMFKYNSFVRLLCTHPLIAPRFNEDRAEDREYLDSLFRLDLEQIAKGALRATEMFAVFEKRPTEEVVAPLLAVGAEVGFRSGPKVSVCVVCDGPTADLETCLGSLFAQTYKNLEILILLPGGEEVAGLARRLCDGRPEVRLVPPASAAGNGPPSWLSGFAAATGECIACLDGRDAWFPIKLSEQVAFLEQRPAVGLVYAQAIVVDDRGRRTNRAFGTDVVGEDLPPEASKRGPGPAVPRSTILLRRACWQRVERAGVDPLTEEELWRQVAAHWKVGFQARPLGMLRAPSEAAGQDGGALRRDDPPNRRHPLPGRPRLLRRIARLLGGWSQ